MRVFSIFFTKNDRLSLSDTNSDFLLPIHEENRVALLERGDVRRDRDVFADQSDPSRWFNFLNFQDFQIFTPTPSKLGKYVIKIFVGGRVFK